jgi:signal transduction histidine kinase
MSVGRRLTHLVVTEIVTALLLLLLGFASVQSLASGSRFMHRFVLVPIQDINAALDDVARLGRVPLDRTRDEQIVARLEAFAKHYGRDIEVAGNPGPDARRQTQELSKLNRLGLVDEEQQVVASLQRKLEPLPAAVRGAGVTGAQLDGLRASLQDLLRLNLQFVDAAQDDIASSAARTSVTLASVGVAGIALAGILAWRVRSAIAPRISALVQKVRKFQEHGVHERMEIEGQDEIAVLGNALDVGFASIAERNRERELFLAVAAHELKTPMVSILGFIDAALANPETRQHALEVIRRQTRRLAHLVEDLLWAASVRSGQLPFHPGPLDVAVVARRLAEEVEETTPGHPVDVTGSRSVPVLADETLFTHALWSLLVYAGVLSAPDQPIDLAVEPADAHVLLRLGVHGDPLPPEDQVRIFEPFSTLQFEGDSRPRSALGLFLCREIARLHGGSLRVGERKGVGPVITLDLPA